MGGLLCAAQLACAHGLPHQALALACGLSAGEAHRWHGNRRLDEAAALWARGATLHDALARSGYTAGAVSGIHVDGLDAPNGPTPNAATCRVLRDQSLIDIGTIERRDELWVIIAAPIILPAPGDTVSVARHALELVNRARQSPQRCGTRAVSAAGPLRLSARLSAAAAQHAQDMAQHHYFEHLDLGGRTPADRVRAAGYAERRVGENIAYGALSTEDAIAGWLRSPAHCENLMDPNFTAMGIAYAPEQGGHSDLYWVQVLATPK